MGVGGGCGADSIAADRVDEAWARTKGVADWETWNAVFAVVLWSGRNDQPFSCFQHNVNSEVVVTYRRDALCEWTKRR